MRWDGLCAPQLMWNYQSKFALSRDINFVSLQAKQRIRFYIHGNVLNVAEGIPKAQIQ